MVHKYAEKLRDPRWQKKRLEVFERDQWACQSCGDYESTLIVHHRLYLPHTEPWDYPEHLLVTLCEQCHDYQREMLPLVLEELKGALLERFLADDIRSLAKGVSQMELLHSAEVVASAYEWALSSPALQRELLSRFLAGLKERLHATH